MDAVELALFGESLRRITEANSGRALDHALADLGWHDALAHNPGESVALLFESQGRAGATSGSIDDVVAAALGLDAGPGTAVMLPTVDSDQPPGRARSDGVAVSGLATGRLAVADTVTVVVAGDEGLALASVKTSELSLRSVSGMDPWLGLIEASGAVTPASLATLEADRWAMAIRHARLAIGHELVGVSAAMLDLACSHALGRVQFGQPIAAFQAVRHRLADTFVAVESARALLAAAWEDGRDDTAAMAKAWAGHSAVTAARHCQQVLAGIGFTTEHPLHRFVRRAYVLDALFGSARTVSASIGADIVHLRRLPPLVPL